MPDEPSPNVRSLLDAKSSVVVTTERAPIERLCLAFAAPDTLARSLSSIKGAMRARLEVTEGHGTDRPGTPRRRSRSRSPTQMDVSRTPTSGRRPTSPTRSRSGRLPPDAPLEARFGLESRPFEKLPAFLQPLPLSGRLEIHGYAQGTISQPFFVAEVRGADLRAPGAPR